MLHFVLRGTTRKLNSISELNCFTSKEINKVNSCDL